MIDLRRARVCAIVLFAAACSSDAPTSPFREAGLFRLTAVNGAPVPSCVAPSVGLTGCITHGDLLLRADGTFAWGETDPQFGVGALQSGTWNLTGSTLLLSAPGIQLAAALTGDSVVLTTGNQVSNLTRLFVRTTLLQPPVISGAYSMKSVGGRTDLIHEYVQDGVRFVDRVLYDSITFSDGVFFRRHRAERASSYRVSGDSSFVENEWITHGSYGGRSDLLVLRDYGLRVGFPALDSLTVSGSTLVRRRRLTNPATGEFFLEDLYSR